MREIGGTNFWNALYISQNNGLEHVIDFILVVLFFAHIYTHTYIHAYIHILYLNTMGFKAQSLWGRVKIITNAFRTRLKKG